MGKVRFGSLSTVKEILKLPNVRDTQSVSIDSKRSGKDLGIKLQKEMDLTNLIIQESSEKNSIRKMMIKKRDKRNFNKSCEPRISQSKVLWPNSVMKVVDTRNDSYQLQNTQTSLSEKLYLMEMHRTIPAAKNC